MDEDEYYEGITWYSEGTPPDKIMLLEESYPRMKSRTRRKQLHLRCNLNMLPIWVASPKFNPGPRAVGITSTFSRTWTTLCGVKFENFGGSYEATHIWNAVHPIISLIDSEGRDWCAKKFMNSLDPLPFKNELLSASNRASAWVIMCLRGESQELWDGLNDRDPTFLVKLWELVFPKRRGAAPSEKVICMWVEDGSDSKLWILSPVAWAELSPYDEEDSRIIMKQLPDPGPEWKVIAHHPQEAIGRKTVV